MEFVYNIRNFDADGRLIGHFEKALNGLRRVATTYGHFERNGDIFIEKLPRGQYLARIYIHLPKHKVYAAKVGYTPIHALCEAVENAKTQVIKIKEQNTDYDPYTKLTF